MKRLAMITLIAVLVVMYVHATVLNIEARQMMLQAQQALKAPSHWGCQGYPGVPRGESRVYQSEYDWFGRAPLQWYTAREDAPTWEP